MNNKNNRSDRPKKIFIIGANGFIGYHLVKELLLRGRYEVIGIDRETFRIGHLLEDNRFPFKKGDIYECWDWIEETIAGSDIILPLAAIAQPKLYVQDPIRVFELDFEANLKIIRMVVKYRKFLIFPSTSEVYGKVKAEYFNEDNTDLVVGPINQQRWIYSAIKQLLDRVIFAYGIKEDLGYCCFRPFNWVGPGLDSIADSKEGRSRVVTMFFSNLLMGKPIDIVGDGKQSRCFTDVRDGVDCLIRMFDNTDACNKQIFNVGNPHNFLSIHDLALKCIETFRENMDIPEDLRKRANYTFVAPEHFYGDTYKDIFYRRPSIEKVKALLSWNPTIDIKESLVLCLDHLYKEYSKSLNYL